MAPVSASQLVPSTYVRDSRLPLLPVPALAVEVATADELVTIDPSAAVTVMYLDMSGCPFRVED